MCSHKLKPPNIFKHKYTIILPTKVQQCIVVKCRDTDSVVGVVVVHTVLWCCSGVDMQFYGAAVVQTVLWCCNDTDSVVVLQWCRHAILWCCSGTDSVVVL